MNHPPKPTDFHAFAVFLAASLCLLMGCAAIAPGSDPVVVRAEQTTAIALDTFDLFLAIERQQESALLKVNPRIHEFAELLRREAPQWFSTARALTASYKRHRTETSKANVGTIVSLLLTSIAEAQRYIGLVNPPPIPPQTPDPRP